MLSLVVFVGCQGPTVEPPTTVSPSFSPSPPSDALTPPYSLAVLPLKNISRQPELHWLSRGLQEMLASHLVQWPQFVVVSRDALGPVLREQWLQQRGFASEDHAVRPGRLSGVRYLLHGMLYNVEDGLGVDLQIIDVETGVVRSSVHALGRVSDLQGLVQDLVNQILHRFESPIMTGHDVLADENGRKRSIQNLTDNVRRETGDAALHSIYLPGPSVDHTDSLLLMESLTHQHREAYRLANRIWNEGWSMEMGAPQYQTRQLSLSEPQALSMLVEIPISLFFYTDRLTRIIGQSWLIEPDQLTAQDSAGLSFTIHPADEAQTVFLEQVYKTRRVFVRARNPHGDVVAVFSDWEWRTDKFLSGQNGHVPSMPSWPQPFLKGLARFPVHVLEGNDSQVSFDAVAAPVPRENIIVRLERMDTWDENFPAESVRGSGEPDGVQQLQSFIEAHWTPPITEALPVEGYLPGNKRTVIGLVHLTEGKVVRLQFLEVPDDPLFLISLMDLESQLVGYCVDCQGREHSDMVPAGFMSTLRLHLTLVKDMQFLRLGPRLSS